MTTGGVLLLLFLLGCAALSVTTLVVAVRGGRGPADPPRSHPAPTEAWPTPRGVLGGTGPAPRPQPTRATRQPALVPRSAR